MALKQSLLQKLWLGAQSLPPGSIGITAIAAMMSAKFVFDQVRLHSQVLLPCCLTHFIACCYFFSTLVGSSTPVSVDQLDSDL